MSKSGLLPIEKTVKNCIQNNFSTTGKLRFIAGVSGGIDSICLLHIFKKLDIEVIAIHVNYQQRGEESDKDAAFVEEICDDWNIKVQIHKTDPNTVSGENFQQWAREVRYEIFEDEAKRNDADGIAIAHHEDDQIETILQKLFRGSGLASWSAMEVWDGILFRPLLSVCRDQIVRYCEEQSIAFRLDQSNLKSTYARNFLRNEWLPELQQHFSGWRKNVLRIAEQAHIFELSLEYILQDISDDKDHLNRDQLLALSSSLQKSVVLLYLRKLDPSISISTDALKELDKLAALQTGKSISLTDELELMRDRSHFTLVTDADKPAASLTIKKKQVQNKPVIFNGFVFQLQLFDDPDFKNKLYLDAKKLSWPLQIRRWNKGDKFQPLGMAGHQSVADHLTNRKISAAEKPKSLVLQSFDATICAVIFPSIEKRIPPGTISEQVKCNDSTRQSLTIKLVS